MVWGLGCRNRRTQFKSQPCSLQWICVNKHGRCMKVYLFSGHWSTSRTCIMKITVIPKKTLFMLYFLDKRKKVAFLKVNVYFVINKIKKILIILKKEINHFICLEDHLTYIFVSSNVWHCLVNPGRAFFQNPFLVYFQKSSACQSNSLPKSLFIF